jgi:NADH dehydrogenase (ubiquinone) flavoprotein 2
MGHAQSFVSVSIEAVLCNVLFLKELLMFMRSASPAVVCCCLCIQHYLINELTPHNSLKQHINTPDNTPETYFDFTDENYTRVYKILSKYPANYKQSGIIPLLDLAQRQHGGWLPVAAMDKVAQIVEVDPARVYEVASFYTMFNRTKVGKYFIQLCGTTPCMICGSEDIKKTIENHLGIKNGETTKDGMFTLLEVECLGACANAPMIQMNDDYYECLTAKTTVELLEACKAGKPPAMGKWGSLPMNGQVSCEGPLGKTSLLDGPPKPPKVDVERFKGGEVDPASVKAHMGY